MSAYVEGLKKGDIFNEYTLVEDFSPSANGFISHAKRNGEDFFIKAFARPKYPKNTHLMSEKIIQKKKERCQVFQKNFIDMVEVFKDNLNQKNGQLIYPLEFHRLDSTYIQISPRIEIAHQDPNELRSYPSELKVILLKSLTNAITLLHKHKIVHSDLKFDNVLIKKTKTNIPVAKIIDFDGSYFDKRPHLPEYMHFDQSYMAPELSLYNQKNPIIKNEDLTTQADVFSLGIIFHEYCTGKRPFVSGAKPNEIYYLGDAINNDEEIILQDEVLGDHLTKIISHMLAKDISKRPTVLDVLNDLSSAEISIKEIKKTMKKDKVKISDSAVKIPKINDGLEFNIISKKKEKDKD